MDVFIVLFCSLCSKGEHQLVEYQTDMEEPPDGTAHKTVMKYCSYSLKDRKKIMF